MNAKLSPRLALLLIAAIFVLPLALAWLMYSGAIDFQPAATRNHGLLVQPPVAVAWSSVALPDGREALQPRLDDHWVVVHAMPSQCEAACKEVVTDLRQVHRAAGRNQARIRLLLILEQPDPVLEADLRAIYPEFMLAAGSRQGLWAPLSEAARATGASGPLAGSTYLVDPLGNIMMYYAPESDPNDLKQDLKRLLTWSKLDESK